MTVSELIEKLKEFDPNATVAIPCIDSQIDYLSEHTVFDLFEVDIDSPTGLTLSIYNP